MSWNYRLMKTTQRHADGTSEDRYAVHEVYYDDDGKPNGYTENPSWPSGETWEEFERDMANYQRGALCRKKDILTPADCGDTREGQPMTDKPTDPLGAQTSAGLGKSMTPQSSIAARLKEVAEVMYELSGGDDPPGPRTTYDDFLLKQTAALRSLAGEIEEVAKEMHERAVTGELSGSWVEPTPPLRDASEPCDICTGGDEVDPRVRIAVGRANLIVHPQCYFDSADMLYRAELEADPCPRCASATPPTEEQIEAIRARVVEWFKDFDEPIDDPDETLALMMDIRSLLSSWTRK